MANECCSGSSAVRRAPVRAGARDGAECTLREVRRDPRIARAAISGNRVTVRIARTPVHPNDTIFTRCLRSSNALIGSHSSAANSSASTTSMGTTISSRNSRCASSSPQRSIPSTRDFNLDIRAAAELDAETLGSLLGTPPMMAERRVDRRARCRGAAEGCARRARPLSRSARGRRRARSRCARGREGEGRQGAGVARGNGGVRATHRRPGAALDHPPRRDACSARRSRPRRRSCCSRRRGTSSRRSPRSSTSSRATRAAARSTKRRWPMSSACAAARHSAIFSTASPRATRPARSRSCRTSSRSRRRAPCRS